LPVAEVLVAVRRAGPAPAFGPLDRAFFARSSATQDLPHFPLDWGITGQMGGEDRHPERNSVEFHRSGRCWQYTDRTIARAGLAVKPEGNPICAENSEAWVYARQRQARGGKMPSKIA
jgi:hypothetical protein